MWCFAKPGLASLWRTRGQEGKCREEAGWARKGHGPGIRARRKKSQQWWLGRNAENFWPKAEPRSRWTSRWACSPGVTGSSPSTARSFQGTQWPTAMGNSAASWNPKPAMGKGWKSAAWPPGTLSSISDWAAPWRAFRQVLWAQS